MSKRKKISFLFISLPWLSNELLWSINKLKQGNKKWDKTRPEQYRYKNNIRNSTYKTIPYIRNFCFHFGKGDGKWKVNIYGQKNSAFLFFFYLVVFFLFCCKLFLFIEYWLSSCLIITVLGTIMKFNIFNIFIQFYFTERWRV